MKRIILPQGPLNMVPLTRTPWGGSLIPEIKSSLLKQLGLSVPERVGESWELSTGNSFPSFIRDAVQIDGEVFPAGTALQDVLHSSPALIGAGVHCSLLLKWLHAQDVLSVQVHPALGDSRLEAGQGGKPESWLVLEVEPSGLLYLGFREGFSQQEIIEALGQGREKEVLYGFQPEKNEYISVVPGCVHAVGPGVLLAEPQVCLPGREGVTLRVSDWGRRYNSRGELDSGGQQRETHLARSLETIDWSLPRGQALRKKYCRVLGNGERFEPPAPTPFPVQFWNVAGEFSYSDLVVDCYSVATVWAGELVFAQRDSQTVVRAGESAFVSPSSTSTPVVLRQLANGEVGAAIFSLRL